jgi:hypothetical protein
MAHLHFIGLGFFNSSQLSGPHPTMAHLHFIRLGFLQLKPLKWTHPHFIGFSFVFGSCFSTGYL